MPHNVVFHLGFHCLLKYAFRSESLVYKGLKGHVSKLRTLYSILMPLKYYVFENIMENGAFALKEQMLHFP